jgi:hypothetical protein
MCPLRLVDDGRAGPAAVGILVPPARRTFVIVRPRSLSFDLLVLGDARGTAFREFDREQAGRAAEALFDALGKWSTKGDGRIELCPANNPGDERAEMFQLRVHVGPFHLLACDRRPGQPYIPLLFSDAACGRSASAGIASLFCPPIEIEQEFYLNTRNFRH